MKLHLPKKLVSLLEENSAHIISLRITILLMFSMLMFALYALYKAPSEILVRIPPDLSNGAVMRVGDVPKSRVMIDTSYLWIEISTWMENGENDAYNNLSMYQNYISERFRNELHLQYKKLESLGELHRQRRISLVPGVLFDFDDRVITKVENKAWIVLLDVIIEDFYLNQPVQDVVVRYPLEVESVVTNASKNPLGIQIVGLADQPTIVRENK